MRIQLKNKSGFSLMELAISTGIVGIVSLGVISINKDLFLTQKKGYQSIEAQLAGNRISNILLNETACQNTLGGKSANGTSFPIIDSRGNVAYIAGQEVGSGSQGAILIKSIQIAKIIESGEPTLQPSQAVIDVIFEKDGGVNVGKNNITIPIHTKVLLTASGGTVSSCHPSIEAYNQNLCSSIGGIWNTNKCLSPQISAVDSASIAVTAQHNLKVNEGNIIIDVDTSTTATTGALSIGNNAEFKNHVTVTTGDVEISYGGLLVTGGDITSTASITATGNSDIISSGDVSIAKKLTTDTLNTSLSSFVGGSLTVTNTATVEGSFDIEGSIIDNSGNNVVTINDNLKVDGTITIKDGDMTLIGSDPQPTYGSGTSIANTAIITKGYIHDIFNLYTQSTHPDVTTDTGNVTGLVVDAILDNTKNDGFEHLEEAISKQLLSSALDALTITADPTTCDKGGALTLVDKVTYAYTANPPSGAYTYYCNDSFANKNDTNILIQKVDGALDTSCTTLTGTNNSFSKIWTDTDTNGKTILKCEQTYTQYVVED